MLVLIVLLIFIIIDLDRPRRGLIAINQASLTQLQDSIQADLEGNTQQLYPGEIVTPEGLTLP